MSTELKRFTEAYATMTVAVYEPMILRWISLIGLRFLSNEIAYRLPKSALLKFDGKTPAGLVLSQTIRTPIPASIDFKPEGTRMRVPIDIHGRALDPGTVTKVDVPGFPNAVAHGGALYLGGVAETDPAQLLGGQPGARLMSQVTSGIGAFTQGLKTIPITVAGRLGVQDPGFDFPGTRDAVQTNLVAAAKEWVARPDADLMAMMRDAATANGVRLPHMWPGTISIHEALSPIGIAHYYRQLYFNKEEGVGPIEEAFTIAPLETFEVIYQTIRKQIHEEVLEQGLETVSESAIEQKNLDEVSDKVSSMVQQDVSASMSASASGSVGVWQAGASASASFGTSSQRGRELSTHRLKEVTRRASERITKSFGIKVSDTTEVTTSTTTRRVIRNDDEHPVSYGLRRVLRRVNVKVQDLGPRLVWQLYLRNPGEGLARSRFVHFQEAAPISVPDIPPGVPPRPAGGVETDAASTSLLYNGTYYYVNIVVKPGDDRDVTGVRIESITDLEGGGKDDKAPAPHNEVDLGSSWDPGTRTYTANIAVKPGDSLPVQVAFSYTWKPSEKVMAAWQKLRDEAAAKITQELLATQFEQQKTLITERSKIKSRPANDLRREERYEVMNRMVSYLFGRGDDPSEPTPLEIEYFHRYFDIDAIFTYHHPSWWKPRFASRTAGFERAAYEITAESEPAPLGSSLGWLLQLDGDSRRNEFLNTPWTRICVPMQAGREREAIEWLANHLEGEVGYDIGAGPLSELLTEIEKFRERERKLGLGGPDYVTVDSTPGAPADPAKPEGVFPVVSEFEVTMPTDGFVYDELKVVIP
jgi:hypothetical protein